MYDVCSNCREYSENKPIDSTGPFVVCQICGYKHSFLQLPLFVVGGVSGTGKTTICLELTSKFTECVVLDSDLLWRAEFATPENNYYSFRSTWLEIAANISQSGRSIALFGIADPERFETLPARKYFSTIYYLLYTCGEKELVQRFQARPIRRQSHTPAFVEAMITFNRNLQAMAKTTQFPVTYFDTGDVSIRETSDYTKCWIQQKLSLRHSSHR